MIHVMYKMRKKKKQSRGEDRRGVIKQSVFWSGVVGDLLGENILCFVFNYYFNKSISNTLFVFLVILFSDLILILIFK